METIQGAISVSAALNPLPWDPPALPWLNPTGDTTAPPIQPDLAHLT